MRAIQKRREPHVLTQHRAQPGANWDNFRDKEMVRAALIAEQHGLCCYCLGRIRAGDPSVHVEHWHPRHPGPQCTQEEQDEYVHEQLSYWNLLGVCGGVMKNKTTTPPLAGEIEDKAIALHYDKAKANNTISINPARAQADLAERFWYAADGKISADEQDLENDIEILRLNTARLKDNRKEALEELLQDVKHLRGTWGSRLEKLRRWWASPAKDGMLRPYCEVALYYLRKKSRLHAQVR